MGLLLVALMILIVYAVKLIADTVKRKQYEKTDYYTQTKNPYYRVRRDKGRLGEFYTYQYLEPLEGCKKYLFNCYLQKENGETTFP